MIPYIYIQLPTRELTSNQSDDYIPFTRNIMKVGCSMSMSFRGQILQLLGVILFHLPEAELLKAHEDLLNAMRKQENKSAIVKCLGPSQRAFCLPCSYGCVAQIGRGPNECALVYVCLMLGCLGRVSCFYALAARFDNLTGGTC